VIVIVFGVSGAGKTTLGKLLARKLGWRFLEADDFHSKSNINKMRAGVPLTGADRWPWLKKLREAIQQRLAKGENAVLACSALKRKYRRYLRVDSQVKFVFLRGDYDLVEHQLMRRRQHFMKPDLLKSQFADLEEPRRDEGVIVIELGRSRSELVNEIKEALRNKSDL
jgi:gluconokinase